MDQTITSAKPHRPRLLFTPRIADVPGVLTFLFILCCGGFSLYQGNSPAAVSANASTTEFSSGRAIKQLQAITKQPHPPGSNEHAAVREYIVETLRGYGLEPEIQTTTVVDPQRDQLLAGTVQNVIADNTIPSPNVLSDSLWSARRSASSPSGFALKGTFAQKATPLHKKSLGRITHKLRRNVQVALHEDSRLHDE